MSRKPLRALIIEHSPLDIELLERELSSSFDVHKGLAGTFKEVEALLNEAQWDIILSDHNLPGWTGMQALALVQERKLDIPFILVTGALGEEQAIEYFRRGITDYVLKHRLELLPVAVSRALQETAMRREKEQSEERYRVLFQEIPLPLWLYDVETLRFLAVNKAAIAHYGFSEDEFKAMTIREIRPAEELPKLLEDLADTETQDRAGIWKHRKKDGSVIDVEVAGHRLEVDGRRVALVLAHDVTEKLALTNQLHHAQKMEALGRLAGGVAHDFNNLLMIINSYAQLLQARPSTDEVSARYAAQIVKAGQRATDVSRQLLLFSRKQLVTPAILDLNNIVNDLATMLPRLIGEDVEMVLALPKGIGLVEIDHGSLEQVIMNLVINARDAMLKGGKLTIETATLLLDDQSTRSHGADVPPGWYVRLSVTDTGVGIAPEIQSRIFEPFFTTKEVGKGTGLGLATAYGIVKGVGGFISVLSEVGAGATFNVFLPRVEEVASTAPHVVDTEAPSGSETLLLVEDEAPLRNAAREYLESKGYHILEASNGVKGLEVCSEYKDAIHVLITDAVMPMMGGMDLAAKATAIHPECKAICMSGYTDRAIELKDLPPGSLVLQKPISLDSLARSIRLVLGDSHHNGVH